MTCDSFLQTLPIFTPLTSRKLQEFSENKMKFCSQIENTKLTNDRLEI